MKKFTFGLRSKVIILSSFLLILPWFAYQYVLEMDKFLRLGQEQTLIGTSRAIAMTLHERPNLFNEDATFLPHIETGKDLYVYELKKKIKLDGELDDWQEYISESLHYGEQYTRYQSVDNNNNPTSFRHMVGKRQGYLYGYLQVTNLYPVYQNNNARTINSSDHLIIALTSPQGELQHYVISALKKGWINAYLKPNTGDEMNQLQREKHIQGYWQESELGYNIEFRLPLEMLGNKLGFALYTVTNSAPQQINTIISTSNIHNKEQLGTVLIPSPEIEQIIKGMSHTQSRIFVLDRHQRVIAKAGDILQADGAWPSDALQQQSNDYLEVIKKKVLSPIYSLILAPPTNDFNDDLKESTQLNSEFIRQALLGKSHSDWSLSSDGKAMILSAASPIMVGNKIMGMVIAQETTNGIKTLRNKALEKIFNVILLIIFSATLAQFLFASNIASRIRKLRDQADNAIDSQGRILTLFSASKSKDEIGHLSRGLFDMVNRLRQYHFYLENLASRLSHELRTPVAVVRSSLENLTLLPQNSENKKYIERAEKGINRLNKILTSMSEATRIEQSLQACEKISFSINELLDNCGQGYQMTYPNYHFQLEITDKPLYVCADPDLIVQLLDKLIGNALEFSEAQNPIKILLKQQTSNALIEISNAGPLLPENMSDQLLNSMVSIRKQSHQQQTHLGLGLFIAKMICEFHQGQIQIQNRSDKSGVQVLVTFPLIKHN
ncbi:proteobacterial dedicated sortase system histidine kinase [Psychromonas sp. MME1]|uniref:proteobacterial dedicated sortase system histidine kinase n=1 Tax=Psychromonas sp. MME1 TaxID=3231032 RepID=UPI0034E1A27A